jgi:uncharacterized protein (TIGR02145 family)
MNGTHVVVENLLPAAPTVFNGSRNCPGTVTLTASSSPDAVIDWYVAIDAASSVYTGTSYTTPEIDESTTYYVQARMTSTGCLSERKPVLAEVITVGCCTAPGSTVTFAEFTPCTYAVTGDAWYLTDTRESAYNNEQTYKVKKLADGHIWMVQDMKFGDKCGTKTTFAGSSSDQTSSKLTTISGYIYGDCTNATNSDTPSNRGYLYDWAGAIQKSGAYYGSSLNVGCSGTATGTTGTNPGSCRGICPVGWHIPTGASSGEYQALHNAFGNCSTRNDDCWDASSAWEGVLGGACNERGSFIYQGQIYYLTSTYLNSDRVYLLYSGSGYFAPGTDSHYKNAGGAVRCVMNY